MELVISAALPFLTPGIMFLVKKLAGLALCQNGATSKPILRFALILGSLLSVVSTSLITGREIDPDSVKSLVLLAIETGLSAFGSHLFYRLIASFAARTATMISYNPRTRFCERPPLGAAFRLTRELFVGSLLETLH